MAGPACNVAGLTGLALLATPLLGATLAWIPPLAYAIYCGGPLDIHHVTLSVWPALPDDRGDFLHRQVLTSRTVRGGVLLDLVLLGPQLPNPAPSVPEHARANLRSARPIVQRFCRDDGLSYCETGLVDSYALALRRLHGVGRALPDTP